ncbi:MAG: MFS transporter [Hyphomicrobiaceae bacterium]|nr:MFS transporter [Hyphomicrobiaceae bacterium]
MAPAIHGVSPDIDGRAAWVRLFVSLAASTMGGVGMWSVVVVLPAVQADFGISRADASLAYTLTMLGFGFGGILMGNFADRFGIFRPLIAAGVTLGLGYMATAYATSLWQFAIAHGLLIGLLGSSVSFGPMLADISHWFERRRGIAVAICASGNYLAGTIWPPIVQHLVTTYGWRQTHVWLGIFCIATIVPLAMLLRRRSPARAPAALAAGAPVVTVRVPQSAPPLPLGALQALLIVAGIACCVAMSMPQVHIVAYCADLGYGAARGAEMLSLMLGFGIVSRLLSGLVADRIGGLATLLLGSILQGVALVLYVPFDGLVSLYVVSALFGLFQGGLVPSYALIVRQFFPPEQAGARVGAVLTATMLGMALGGWLSGVIFDLTGSYRAAFLNGIAWNLLNVVLVVLLMWRRGVTRRSGGSLPVPA